MLHAFLHGAVAQAVHAGGMRGIVGLQETQMNAAVSHGLAAPCFQRLNAVSLGDAEVDDRLHILRHHIAGGAAAPDHRGGDGGGYKGEKAGMVQAMLCDGSGITGDILNQRAQGLLGDVGGEGGEHGLSQRTQCR